MSYIELKTSTSQARISHEQGFNCYHFQTEVAGKPVDLIDAPENFELGNHRPSSGGIPILFPFPNRIRGGAFAWEGKSYQLPPGDVSYDSAGNAIHGFCLDRPWRIVDQTPNSVTGVFQLSIDAPERLEFWPADFILEAQYVLTGPALLCGFTITNPDTKPLPWGLGTHPYFRLPLTQKSEPKNCLIEVEASEQWELVNCLPTGLRVPVTSDKDLRQGAYFDVLKLDDVYTGLPDQRDETLMIILDEKAGLQMTQRCDSLFREVVIYTPAERPCICLEPYTCVTDAINLDRQGIECGWQVLPPGETQKTWVEISASQIIV